MKTFQISDPNGQWFQNSGQFQFHDPESNTLFPPGVLTKATPTAWLESMSALILPAEDPTQAVEVEQELPVLEPVVAEPSEVDPMQAAEASVEVKDITPVLKATRGPKK